MSTIYDVAKLVGVSHSAVSAVLNDKPIHVSEATRQRIIEGAKKLGYRTNRAAQQLRTGKFDTIAVCFGRVDKRILLNDWANEAFAGVGHAASKNGLRMLFEPIDSCVGFEQTIDDLPMHGVDGGIIMGPIVLSDDSVSVIDRCKIPLVCIDSNPRLAMASTIDSDNLSGMKMGVEHLINSGHKKMAYIGPPPLFQCLLDRMGGFYKAVQDAGLSLTDQSAPVAPLEEVPAVMRRLMETIDRPTALICAQGDFGAAVLDEVTRMGLSVPDDLSALIYDHVGHPLIKSANVIRNDFCMMGEAACDLLTKLISGECSGPVSLRLLPELILATN